MSMTKLQLSMHYMHHAQLPGIRNYRNIDYIYYNTPEVYTQVYHYIRVSYVNMQENNIDHLDH